MKSRLLPLAIIGSLVLGQAVRADTLEPKYQAVVNKGLEYLARTQFADGHWDGGSGPYPVTMTAMAGMAFLMEGSTLREGKYSQHLRKAANWLLQRSNSSGLIGNPSNSSEGGRYMYGHGFALLFLASVYGEEEDASRRKKLEEVLTRAAMFTYKAQTNRGGWGYLTSVDGGGFDEGSVTITQLQALRAARNAGIPVPKECIDNAQKYLEKCTTPNGGVIYSLAQGGRDERPAITAAAVTCAFSSGQYDSESAKKWITYCRKAIPIDRTGNNRYGHWEYTHYYYAQVIYVLGDKGYARLFPKSSTDEQLTWKKYKAVIFDYLASQQSADGSWAKGYIGPAYTTACYLTIMQLDNGVLPIYQR